MVKPSSFLFAVLSGMLAAMVAAMNSTDDWITVDKTDIWRDLPSCAQSCVRDVNQQIVIQNTHCQSYGCVCAESTQGLNFIYGLGNVTECARKSCSADQDVSDAETAFQDLCLVYAANSTRPATAQGKNITLITAEGYSNLTECAKFALNGCLNEDGVRNETNCGPARQWEHWEDYRGVAAQRQCSKADCLCKKENFDASFAVAYEAGERYCGMWLSTQALPNEEYEDMQNVFAMYCTGEGFPPKDWWLRIVGNPPASVSNETSPKSNETDKAEGWSRNDKLQLGLGAGIGVPGLIIATFAAIVSWKQYRWAVQAESRTGVS